MEWVPPPPGTLLAFSGLAALACGLFVLGAWRAAPEGRGGVWGARAALGLTLWLALLGALPSAGLLELGFPALMGFFVSCNGMALLWALSRLGRAMSALPIAALIGVHALRLPLEVLLHLWAEAGSIPVSMSWSGQNLDVITGVAALLLAPLAWRAPNMARPLAWGFTALGGGLLLNVMRVAVLSAPGPMRAFGDPPLLLAYHLPTIWIVPVFVSGALFAHVVLLRRLLGR